MLALTPMNVAALSTGGALYSIPYPPFIFPGDQATFTSTTGWSSPAGITFDTTPPGKAVAAGSVASINLDHGISPVLSTAKTYTIQLGTSNRTAGRTQIVFRTSGVNTTVGANNYQGMQRVQRFTPVSAYDTLRISLLSQTGNPAMYVIDAQIADITSILAQPYALVAQGGQSNNVGAFGVTGYDPEVDKPEFRALAIPSQTSTPIGCVTDGTGASYGLTSACGIGTPMTISTPLTHATSAQVNEGDPVATMTQLSEATYLCDHWAYPGYTPTFLLGAATATSLFTAGGWDPTTTPKGSYLRLLVANIDAALAARPGSFLAGLDWQQGEADLSRYADYNAQFTTMINYLRGLYGNFPIVITEIGGLTSDPGTAQMIATQKLLASNSGSAAALPLCAYIPRPAGLDTDLLEAPTYIHYTATTNRQFGLLRGAQWATFMKARQHP